MVTSLVPTGNKSDSNREFYPYQCRHCQISHKSYHTLDYCDRNDEDRERQHIERTVCKKKSFTVHWHLNVIKPSVEKFLLETLKKEFDIAVVGGSDIAKIKEQLGGGSVFEKYQYVFAENGLIAFKNGKQLPSETIQSIIGEDALQDVINFALRYISELKLPFKRGTFVEFRTGMLNISPVGRNCNKKEREQFKEYDCEHQIRQKFIQALKKEFPDLALTYSIGGEISFDVFPNGWDKTYCLRHIQGYDEIHFFGDKTEEGGNDHEIYESELTVGHRVTGPEDTIKQLKVLVALINENREKDRVNIPMQCV